ncbi:hypothetical protein MPER_12608 [Moniliophthora perniciosa FA553]|nr:hypothetical protein MPER_12608 [Moniliophthora perniciosa FA553]
MNNGDLEEPIAKAAAELRKDPTHRSVRSAEWNQDNGLLVFRGKVYVPKDKDLRRRIVEQHDDSHVAGHPGRFKTLELVSRNYWWPQMNRYIGQYTRTCQPCIRAKIQRHKPVGELHPTPTAPERWHTVSVDFIVELPEAHGFDAVMNVVDTTGKRAHFLPTHTTVNAEGAARLYLKDVWKHHGLPVNMISDRGTQVVAEFTRELYRLLGIKVAASTAYHPQTDGQTERVNQELEEYLRLFVSHRQDDWDELLPLAEFSYNNHIHSSTQQTPFMLDTGRNPRMGFEPNQPPSEAESVNQFKQRMQAGLEEAKAALDKAKQEYAQYYNRRRIPAPEFKPGDKVWLDASDIQTDRPSRKLADRNLGPFVVERRVGFGAYKLKLPTTMKQLHPVFPVVKLTAYTPDPIPGQAPKPPPAPVVIEGEKYYKIETIIDAKYRWRSLWYLCKFEGYRAPEWVRYDDLNEAQEKLDEFYHRVPGAPRRVVQAIFTSLPFHDRKAEQTSNWRERQSVPLSRRG